MKTAHRPLRPVLAAVTFILVIAAVPSAADITKKGPGHFTITHEVVLPDSPEAVYDAVTGDISGWWDHSFSGSPRRFYIEPRPGGGFYEIFDESGDGVLHATVTWAQRGSSLRFEGPLGLAGYAVTGVWTYTFEPHEKGTKLTLTGAMSGALEDGWAEVVDSVWHHFLVERLTPYIEKGEHKKAAGKNGDGA